MVKLHFLPRILIWIGCLFFVMACNSDVRKDQGECSKGAPSPVFNSDYDFVISHEFKSEGQNSSEKIVFAENLQLTIRQSGCDKIFQSYNFLMRGDFQNQADEFWLDRAVQAFYKLGSFEEKFYVFNLWANKIQGHKADFKLTEAFQAETGIYIKIDRILSPTEAQLIVDLYEN